MSHCQEVFFDADFPLPPECPSEGAVRCRVISADCCVLHGCGESATVVVRLLLSILISNGAQICAFERQAVFNCRIPADCGRVRRCKVVDAVCDCVVLGGRVLCCLMAKLCLERKRPCPPSVC